MIAERFQLFPQMVDVYFHNRNRRIAFKSPDPVKNLFTRKNIAAVLDQVFEQFVLCDRQFQRLAVDFDFFFFSE